ncbi:glycosyltransferase [bacterium]|nr:glycosyltransferase [bacterium]
MADALYVVIATAGQSTRLARTLESLAACDKPAIYRSTIVVENGPKLGAEAIVRLHEKTLSARYLHSAQANKSNALNLALETLESGLVFFTDDDVRIEAGTLADYAKAAEGLRRGQFYGGPTRVDYEQTPPEWLIPLFPPSARGLDAARLSNTEKLWFLGFNWAAFVEDLKMVNGFDSMLGPGSPINVTVDDETEMQRRLIAAGVQPRAVFGSVVWHYVPKERSTLKWMLQRAYRHGLASGVRGTEKQNSTLFRLIVIRGFVKQFFLLAVNGLFLKKFETADALVGIWFRTGQIRSSLRPSHPVPTNASLQHSE